MSMAKDSRTESSFFFAFDGGWSGYIGFELRACFLAADKAAFFGFVSAFLSISGEMTLFGI